jgi:hypothetical protein
VGGYAKVDVIHDFKAIGNHYQFATSTIGTPGTPADGSEGQTTFNARESRVAFELRSDTPVGGLHTMISGDFYGAGGGPGNFRLRQAYGELGNFMAGQAWSTFQDLSSRPETLDFEGPSSELSVRQPLLRWTQPLATGVTIAVAAEMPSSAVTNGANLTEAPDGVLRGRVEGDAGHLQLAGIARQIRTQDATDPDADIVNAFGWGGALTGSLNVPLLHDKDNVDFQIVYGDGIGRYVEDVGFDAFFDAPSGSVDTLTTLAGYLGLQHWWSDRVRSTAVGAFTSNENVEAQPDTAFASSMYLAGNVIVSPVPQADIGLEYLYGQLYTSDETMGDNHRAQFSTKFKF